MERPPAPPPPPPKHANRNDRPCWQFSLNKCSRGAACPFAHRALTAEETAERDATFANHLAKRATNGKGSGKGFPEAMPPNGIPANSAAPAGPIQYFGDPFAGQQATSAYQLSGPSAVQQCPNFSAGNCRLGQNCKYAHDVRQIGAAAVPLSHVKASNLYANNGNSTFPYPHVTGYGQV